MDDIYGNLENYNEVHLVEELRNENQDLKSKLSEYAISMDKLQKDFDNLSNEYNILKTNYSSLLKTARAEIERKTQLITNLNIEKDMMVLKGIQNRNFPHPRYNFNRQNKTGVHNNYNLNNNKNTNDPSLNINLKKDTANERITENKVVNKEEKCSSVPSNKDNKNIESKENVQLPTTNTFTSDIKTRSQSIRNRRKSMAEHRIKDDQMQSGETQNLDGKGRLPANDVCNVESSSNRSAEVTPSMNDPKNDTGTKSRPRSIRDRRKSMPASSYTQAKFSSDEESEDKHQDSKRTELHKQVEVERKTFEKSTDRSSAKISESSTDRYSGHQEPSRDGHYRSRNKHYEDERYRYDKSQRYRPQYSPERGQRRSLRDEEYHDRQRFMADDYNRQRNMVDDYSRPRNMVDDYGRPRNMVDDFNRHRNMPDDYNRHKNMSDDYNRHKNMSDDYNRHRNISDDYNRHKNMSDDYNRQRNKADDYSRPKSRADDYDKQKFGDYGRPKEIVDNCGRRRILESPPKDKHHSRRDGSRDKRSSHSSEHPQESDRSKHQSVERRGTKHKADHDTDEPDSKRTRMESHTKTLDDEEKYKNDMELINNPMVYHSSVPEYMQATSCQSPDLLVHGNNMTSSPPIKEIMNIANTKLEDPRVTHKNYVVKTEDNKVVLSTITGRDVDLKKVNKKVWNIPEVDMPEALMQKPDYSEEAVKEIYFDIDNPLDISKEPGELSDIDDIAVEFSTETPKNYEINTVHQDDKEEQAKIENVFEVSEKNDDTTKPKPKYKIPKIKKSKDHSNNDKMVDSTITDNKEHNIRIEKTPPNKLITNNQLGNADDKKQKNHDIVKKLSPVQPVLQIEKQRVLTTREIVAGDLELSDESSDNIDLNSFSKLKNNSQPQSENIEFTINDYMPKTSDNPKPNVDSEELKHQNTEENVKEKSDDNKKHKSKRNRTKSTCIQESNKNTPAPNKKTKSKKEKTSPQDIKTKFCDLFGDTTSLITPEDLGLTTEVKSNCDDLPIFEDAQDAIDINIVNKILPDTTKDVLQTDNSKNPIALLPTFSSNNENKSSSNLFPNIEIGMSVPTLEITDPKNGYENINSEFSVKEGDVLKTVIISTGVQLQHMSENDDFMVHQEPNINADQKFVPKCRGMTALATSTPQKDLNLKSMQVDVESSCTSSDSRATSNDNFVVPSSQSSISILTPGETPDVRIFVKRKKRAIKRPTPS